MSAKILASYDSVAMEQSHGTSSGQTPGTGEAEYFDPLTGNTTTAETAEALSDIVAQAGGFVSKAKLQSEIHNGKLSGDIRKAGGEEWDMLVVDLSQYPTQEQRQQARRVIIETLANPDYVAKKNQDGGRFQDVKVKGRRAVSAWGIHDQQTAGEHFHVYVHHHAIDGQRVCPRASLKDNHIREQEIQALQKALRAAGLAELDGGGILTPAASTSGTPQAQQAVMQAQAVAAANGQAPSLPAPQPLAAIAPQAAATTFDKNAQEADAEAAKLLAAANEAAQRAQTLRQASTAIAQVEALRQRAEQSEKRAEQREQDLEKLKQDHQELARKHHELAGDRTAVALAVVNILGLGEEAVDLPAAELEALAAQAWENETKAKATAQQEAKEQKERANEATNQVVEEQTKRVEAEQARDKAGAEAVEARRQRSEQEKRADDLGKQLADERKASDQMRAEMMKQMQEQQAEFMKQLRQQQSDFMKQLQNEQKEKSALSEMVDRLSNELKELQEKLGQAMNTIKDMVSGAQAKAAKRKAPAKPTTPKAGK